jgi:raffinose/stachyose/melibiose transport system permease protein
MTANVPATAAATASFVAEEVPPHKSKPPKERVNRGATTLIAIGSLFILIPLYFTLAMSLKTQAQSTGSGFQFPTSIRWKNFSDAWALVDFPRAATVSILIAIVAVAGEVFISAGAAWAIARNFDNKLFKYSFYYILAAMFIPFPVVALAQIRLTALVHLDNPAGVALLHILFALPFNILLFTAFIRTIPVTLEESAAIDGCTPFRTFSKVVFPLLGPMAATVGIFAFLGSWNDFMMPSLITANSAHQTLPVVQNVFVGSLSANYNVAMASYLLAIARCSQIAPSGFEAQLAHCASLT